jgi:hypothetical protein
MRSFTLRYSATSVRVQMVFVITLTICCTIRKRIMREYAGFFVSGVIGRNGKYCTLSFLKEKLNPADAGLTAESSPDPEVPEQARRRKFSAKYKLRIPLVASRAQASDYGLKVCEKTLNDLHIYFRSERHWLFLDFSSCHQYSESCAFFSPSIENCLSLVNIRSQA